MPCTSLIVYSPASVVKNAPVKCKIRLVGSNKVALRGEWVSPDDIEGSVAALEEKLRKQYIAQAYHKFKFTFFVCGHKLDTVAKWKQHWHLVLHRQALDMIAEEEYESAEISMLAINYNTLRYHFGMAGVKYS